MSLLDKILNRRSVRRYKPDLVPTEVLNSILEAGRMAPSASNRQPWHFIVVTDRSLKQKLSQGRWNKFIAESAFTVVGCGDPTASPKWHVIDVAIALQNMVVVAWAQGVGSCWIGDFVEDQVKKILGIPERLSVIALASFGYPAEQPTAHGKKSLNEIAHYNRF